MTTIRTSLHRSRRPRHLGRTTLVLAALTLAACSQGSATQGSGGGDASDGTVTLTFQSLSDQPGAIAATKEIVDAWNAENPSAQVQIVQGGWDGVYDKLVTQFSGASAPDIIHYEAASIASFARDGYLAELKDIDEAVKNDIPQGLWDSVTVDDKVVAVPTEVQTYVVFANRKLLEAAGQEIPTGESMTYEDLQALAKATTKPGQYGMAWGLRSPTATFMTLGLGTGGSYFEGSGTDATIDVGSEELAVPQTVRAMKDAKTLDPVVLTQAGKEALAAFYAGKAAMTVQGSFQAANMAKEAPEGLDWVVLPPLAGSAGALQAANPQTLSVNADAADVTAATEFVSYFASPENLAAINKADALIPSSMTARETILTETGGEDGWEGVMATAAGLEGAPFMSVDAYAQWKDAIATPEFQRYLAGETDDSGLATGLTEGFTQLNR